jgi:hypothetical protein
MIVLVLSGVWLTVYALNMRALRQLRDRERVIRLKVAVAKAGQLPPRIAWVQYSQKRILCAFEERHAKAPNLR